MGWLINIIASQFIAGFVITFVVYLIYKIQSRGAKL